MRADGGYRKGPPREHIRDMSRMVIGPIHRSEGLVGRYPRGHLRDPGVQILSHQIRRSSNPEVMKSGGHEFGGHGSRYRYTETSTTRNQPSDGCQLESQIRQYAECVQWCPPGHMAYRYIPGMLHILMSKRSLRGYRSTRSDPEIGMSNIQISDIRNMGMSKM